MLMAFDDTGTEPLLIAGAGMFAMTCLVPVVGPTWTGVAAGAGVLGGAFLIGFAVRLYGSDWGWWDRRDGP
jgi:hypothetical protein